QIPYTSASRPVDPKGYAVTYKVEDDYLKKGFFTAMTVYNTHIIVGAENGNVDPGLMEWYLSRTHP
ncbi:hypothetical protein LINGRAHAP2_LOCUS24325, partial [Linum grandiflorum]